MSYLRLCLFGLLILCSPDLFSKEIFVSTKGNDKNSGTKDQPVATLEGARDLVRRQRATGSSKSEIRIIIADGTYLISEPLVLTSEDSGSAEAQTIFTAEEGAHPVFIGGIQIVNWEKISDNLWKAKVPEVQRFGLYFEQLFVNMNILSLNIFAVPKSISSHPLGESKIFENS